MTKHAATRGPKPVVLALATLLLIRGILILFTTDRSDAWNNLLGVGGLAAADAQFGWPGTIMRIAQLSEGRLWIILAFPLFLRLAWGRDLAILAAGLGMLVQVFRLLAGNSVLALVWLLIFAGIAALFYARSDLKTYFAHS